jgi:hypothetical protein
MIAFLLSAAMLAADTNHFVVCPTLPATSDTVSETVYGTVSDPFTRLALPAGFSGVMAEAVRATMKIPANMPIVVFDPRGRPTIVTTAAFSLMPNGTARNVAEMSSSSSTAIDSMLIAGIAQAAKDSSFPPLPPRAGNGIRLAFTLSTDSTEGAAPMFSIRLPQWRDFAPARLSGRPDTVAATVIIDEKGVPLLGTISAARVLSLDQLQWFRDARFVPGHVQRCAVRSLVHLPVSARP